MIMMKMEHQTVIIPFYLNLFPICNIDLCGICKIINMVLSDDYECKEENDDSDVNADDKKDDVY